MKFSIRTDASYVIGIGHVMRCLTLADEMRERGNEVQFICREHVGNAVKLIQRRGYKVFVLPLLLTMQEQSNNISGKEENLGSKQIIDAKETSKILLDEQPDWLIVDHYSIDIVWHKYVYSYCKKIMVIDDLADREYKCDLLLDSTFGRKETEYDVLLPSACKCLIGTHYALIRPQFAELRHEAEEKRKSRSCINRILVSLGGNDSANLTSTVLDGLKEVAWGNDIEIDVVLAANAPHLTDITSKIKDIDLKVNILSNVENMAEIMLSSDLAIGAGGSTTWERCVIGLPSIFIIYAQNQLTIVNNICQAGAGINLGWFNKIEPNNLKIVLEKILKSPSNISLISENSFAICDGLGVQRVADIIEEQELKSSELVTLKQVTLEDSKIIYDWQASKGTREYFSNPVIPKYEEHLNWMKKKLKETEGFYKLVLYKEIPVGVLRLDKIEKYPDGYFVSILLADEFRGKGIGYLTLLLARKTFSNKKLYASIHEKNISSKKLFLKAGYEYYKIEGCYINNIDD